MVRTMETWLVALLVLGTAAACDEGDEASPAQDAVEATEPIDSTENGDSEDSEVIPPTVESPAVEDWRVIVPSAGLPSELAVQPANNNLSITEHNGRLYLAWRTGPTHFASPEVRLYIASTEDEVEWRFEGEFHLGTDLREPNLLSFGGDLFLYFAVLGESPLDFEPEGTMVSRQEADGSWTEPLWLYEPGFLLWRVRTLDGVPNYLGYIGGENIYDVNGDPIQVHWLVSADGYALEPAVNSRDAVIHLGGASEADLAILDDGSAVAVMRNEAGDSDGFGSKICRAEGDDLQTWRCETDKRKFDSPYVFRKNGRVWLLGRRNVTEDGFYDLGHADKPINERALDYQLEYWNQPKRCALWEVDPDALTVEHVLDLPSKGDTCFPSGIDAGADTMLIYNYSSDVDGPDLSWIEGQLEPTHISRQVLRFPPTDAP